MYRKLQYEFRMRIGLKSTTVLLVLSGLMLAGGSLITRAQSFEENFELVPVPGWTTQNNSASPASDWFQGNPSVFPAHMGSPESYIGVNFNSTVGTNTISNWLISPNRTFNNGDRIRFWTRTVTPGANFFPDRLQVRLSSSGESTNVGTGPFDVGDFTELLLDINPDYQADYPFTFEQFEIIIVGLSGPTSGRIAFRYFVEDGGPTGDNSNYIGIDTFSYEAGAVTIIPQHVLDFNGDGKTDYAVVRNTGGGPSGQISWFVELNGPQTRQFAEWGLNGDSFVPADYDGDNKTDIAVWRAGEPFNSYFYILNSATNTFSSVVFGQNGDDPKVVGDYTGDGLADPAVYRSGASPGDKSFWYYFASSGPLSGQIVGTEFGQNGDSPAPGDYNGDGMADFVIRRDTGGGQGAFLGRYGTGGGDPGGDLSFATLFGLPTDDIVPGDYDGDGATDIAVVRDIDEMINWFYDPSGTPGVQVLGAIWGASATDFPVQGDYDGDGRTDFAVWRPSSDPTENFFIVRRSGNSSPMFFEWGQQGDYPVANYNNH